MFYEIECQTCNKCGKSGLKCTQLTSEIEAIYIEVYLFLILAFMQFNLVIITDSLSIKDDGNLWTEPLTMKSGCACVSSSHPSSANIRP